MKREKDMFDRSWITTNAIDEIKGYSKGMLIIRGLHYRLVSRGMTNTTRHYKRVVSAMIKARWDGLVSFDTFSDHDREMIGGTDWDQTILEDKVDVAKDQLTAWMTNYRKNRWENQPYYPEVFIEKKALQGVFQRPCYKWDVGFGACKGYPSLTFLNDAANRFIEAENMGKIPVVLYFGDYDPSGEDIPRSIKANLIDLGVSSIMVIRKALLEDQVIKWNLPPAPVKVGDSRSASWDGLGQVELDALEPKLLQELCEEAIENIFDPELYEALLSEEASEREVYRNRLKIFVNQELSE